jgi:hypothetical protein
MMKVSLRPEQYKVLPSKNIKITLKEKVIYQLKPKELALARV